MTDAAGEQGLPERRHSAVVVDDDADMRRLIVHVLERAGIAVETAASGAEALEVVRRVAPDLVTLDLTLPDMDGTEVCRSLRGFSDAYVIMITGRDSEIDRLLGLDVGADDYMSKPFSPQELRARTAALLRRPRASGPEAPATQPPAALVEVDAGFTLLPSRQLALVGEKPLPLTPAEVDLLAVLTGEPGRAFPRADLANQVWKGAFTESDFLVDVHVATLRRKLRKADPTREWISTIDGVAYRWAST